MKGVRLFLGSLVCASPLLSKDLGQRGTTFEITEPCLLTTLQARLRQYQKSGNLDLLQQKFHDRVKKGVQRPRPVEGLQEATRSHRQVFDPSLTLRQDIVDDQGTLLGRAGQKINPLSFISFGAPMLFLDGDNPAHVTWARAQDPAAQWVLIKGSPFDLQDQEQRTIYFDQGGRLARHFGVRAVPTRLFQEGMQLILEACPSVSSLQKEAPHTQH